MRKFVTYGAGLMLSASVMTSAVADTVTMWTMEEQPDVAAQERIAADFKARTGCGKYCATARKRYRNTGDSCFCCWRLYDVLNHAVQRILPFVSGHSGYSGGGANRPWSTQHLCIRSFEYGLS